MGWGVQHISALGENVQEKDGAGEKYGSGGGGQPPGGMYWL